MREKSETFAIKRNRFGARAHILDPNFPTFEGQVVEMSPNPEKDRLACAWPQISDRRVNNSRRHSPDLLRVRQVLLCRQSRLKLGSLVSDDEHTGGTRMEPIGQIQLDWIRIQLPVGSISLTGTKVLYPNGVVRNDGPVSPSGPLPSASCPTEN
jgi:hypothetical protein